MHFGARWMGKRKCVFGGSLRKLDKSQRPRTLVAYVTSWLKMHAWLCGVHLHEGKGRYLRRDSFRVMSPPSCGGKVLVHIAGCQIQFKIIWFLLKTNQKHCSACVLEPHRIRTAPNEINPTKYIHSFFNFQQQQPAHSHLTKKPGKN